MILVTGATGQIGRHVVRQLTERDVPTRVMARNPDTVQTAAEVVHGDFDDPSSLTAAVSGIEVLFLLTAPRRPVADHDAAMLEAAAAAGVKRVVKLSAMGSGSWHLLTEDVTRTSGLEWTILKPGNFASNLLGFAEPVKAGLPVPDWNAHSRFGVIDPRDVAAVAVETLVSADHAGQTYTLTGPELLTFADQLTTLGTVLNRRIETLPMSVEEAGRMMQANGMHPDSVDVTTVAMRRARDGEYALLTDTVTEITGRVPGRFETWVRDHQDRFR
jgi:uncharacterized protein YbjT (DUF2867 family)